MVYSNKTVKTIQASIYLFMHLFFKIFFKTNLKMNLNFKKNKRYIFTPNHPWRMDPFLIFYLMPFKTLIKILPLRFMTAKEYMENSFNNIFLSLLGCYPVDKEVLNKSVILLKNKSNLCIFIQGKINPNNKKPKIGAIYIHNKFKKSQLIPIKISINKPLTFFNILFRKVNINVIFKKPFKTKPRKNLQITADELLREIIG